MSFVGCFFVFVNANGAERLEQWFELLADTEKRECCYAHSRD